MEKCRNRDDDFNFPFVTFIMHYSHLGRDDTGENKTSLLFSRSHLPNEEICKRKFRTLSVKLYLLK